MARVICHTADCENNGVPIELAHPMELDPETGNETNTPVNPWVVYCGPCGQVITDIVEDGS